MFGVCINKIKYRVIRAILPMFILQIIIIPLNISIASLNISAFAEGEEDDPAEQAYKEFEKQSQRKQAAADREAEAQESVDYKEGEIREKERRRDEFHKQIRLLPIPDIDDFMDKVMDNIANPASPAGSWEEYLVSAVGKAVWQEVEEFITQPSPLEEIARLSVEIDNLKKEISLLRQGRDANSDIVDELIPIVEEAYRRYLEIIGYIYIRSPDNPDLEILIQLYIQDPDNPDLKILNPIIAGMTQEELERALSNPDPVFIHSSRAFDIDILGKAVPYQFSPGSSVEVKDTITITYTVPFRSYVTILIYDSNNSLVRTVAADELTSIGDNTFTWDGKDDFDTLVAEGTYRYVITAYDVLDPNRTYTESNQILIDNTPPLAEITQISGDYPDSGKTQITGTAQDSNLECYTLECLNTELPKPRYETETTNDTLATIYTYSLLNGTYTFQLLAKDLAGNSTVTQDVVSLSNQHELKVMDLAITNSPISQNIAPGAGIIDEAAIFYTLSHTAIIDVDIYDSGAIPIRHLITETQDPGLQKIIWDGKDDYEVYVPPGDYTVKVSSETIVLAEDTITVTDNVSKITKPFANSLVRAYIPITGTATCENFSHYTVEYGQGKEPTTWIPLVSSNDPVINSILTMWDTGYSHPAYCEFEVPYPSEGLIGPYSLRLTTYDTTGGEYIDEIAVTVGRVFSNEWTGEARSPDDKVHLSLKPMSLESSFELISILSAIEPPLVPPELKLVGTIYELEQPGIHFTKPATLTISYLDGEITGHPEEKLGIYEYDIISQRWKYLPTTIDVDNNILTSQINSTPLFRAYYAIFCDTSPPQPPAIYQVPSPINRLSTIIYGETDPQTKIEVFVNGASQGMTDIIEGDFFAKQVVLNEGVNHITACAIDIAGNISNTSTQLDPNTTLGQPTTIDSITAYASDFSTTLTTTQAENRLYIELIGEDADPNKINTTTVLVTSSVTDPSGILVTLTETGINTGVYRGVIYVGRESNEITRTIGALDGEEITVSSTVDPTKEIFISVDDTKAPGVPSVYSSTDPSVCQNTFEDNLGDWRNRSGASGAYVYRDGTTSATGTFSAKIVNEHDGGDFSCYVLEDSYDAEQYPIVSFDYKIGEGVKSNFRVKVNGIWTEIIFTDPPGQYSGSIKIIGEFQNVVADNEWHRAEINLFKMLERHFPEAPSFIVTEIIMGEWDMDFWYMTIPGGNNAQGATYWIDNFIITKPVKQPFEINWEAPPDEPFIAGYSYLIDLARDSIPDTTSEGTATSKVYDGLADGNWYFHIRAQDNAGNWSGANHYLILKDDTPPEAGSPYPADGATSGSPFMTLEISDGSGVGVDENTIQFQVEEATYDVLSPALDYNSVSQTLTFTPHNLTPTSLIFTDGQEINVSLLTVGDKAGNSIPSPYNWSWIYDVDLDNTPPATPTILYPKSHLTYFEKVVFTWISYDTSGIAGYSFLLDDGPNTIVDRKSEGLVTQKGYELSEGLYYFHVAAVDNAGNWSETSHFELRVLPGSLLVDDFEGGAPPNSLGCSTATFDSSDGSFCNTTYINNPSIVMGSSGYSLKLNYKILLYNSFAAYMTAFSFWDVDHMEYRDLSRYQSLSLWVKGVQGGEVFNVGLKDSLGNECKVNVNDYLAGGVTSSWQKAVIPLGAFTEIETWDAMDNLTIVFEAAINSGEGTVYIDNIELLAGYIPIDNFDAAEPQNTPGNPYWSFSNNEATIQVGYDSSGAYGGSGHSLEITYSVRLPYGAASNSYCGWIIHLGGMDVSYLNTLGFYAKGAVGGEHFNVYLNDSVTGSGHREFVDIRDYLTLRDDWHYVKIPLADFANKGVDLSHVEKLEIVFEWEEMSGTVYIDNIEFTNDLFKEASIGPVRVSGQNLLVHGELFTIQGVCYQPTPIGYYPNSIIGTPAIYPYDDTPYNSSMWERDLNYLRDMHCNTIRTWGKVTSAAFLDACYNNGVDPVYIIMGMRLDERDYSLHENRMAAIDEFAQYVETYKDHPAVLMWAIGNEDNYSYGGMKRNLYTLINELARTAYEIEGHTYHPVTFPNGDLFNIGDDSVRATDTAVNYLDIWSANAYRGPSFGDLFIDYQYRSTKPLLITEYGIDAWDNIHSVEYEDEQANYAIGLWKEIVENSNFCVGATIMEYSDEWWRDNTAGSTPETHDYGGYRTGTTPDGFSNEEWWGIMRIAPDGTRDSPDGLDDVEPRQLYYDLKKEWAAGLLIDDFDDGIGPNQLGGATGTFANPGSYCDMYYDDVSPYGDSGYSLKIDYDVIKTGGSADYYSLLQNLDARKYNTLSFWVKGDIGGEIFNICLRDTGLHQSSISILHYLPQGVTTEWQKVAIPLIALRPFDYVDWNELERFLILFTNSINSGSGTIYIDDIKLEKKSSPLVVDNFNDNINQNALGGILRTWGTAPISTGYDISNPCGGAGKSYYITYEATPDYWSAWTTELNVPNGIDISSRDTLSFYIRGATGGERPNVWLKDKNGYRNYANIENFVIVTTDWQRVSIPLSHLLIPPWPGHKRVDLAHIKELSFIFEWERMSGTIYIDNIAFGKNDAPPNVSSPYPPNGAVSGSPVITLRISDPLGFGIEERTIQLQVEGVTYEVSSPALDYDSTSQILKFTPYNLRPMPLVFTDGQEINISLLTVSNKAGNYLSVPYSWSWVYDVDSDDTLPEPPTILSPSLNIADPGRVRFSWISYDTSGIAGYSFLLDDEPNTIVDEVSEGPVTQKEYWLPQGTYYFHVAAVDNAGNWSETSHFELRVLPGTLLVDDFDDGAKPNSLGGDMGTSDSGDGSYCDSHHINNAGIVMGGSGYSLMLNYDVFLDTGSQAGYWTGFNNMDLSMYQSLSLWVKGADGGEVFNIGLKDSLGRECKVNVNDYLAGGVTSSWQKVAIPLNIFTEIETWNVMDSLIIMFEAAINSGTGTVYIDDIKLLPGDLPIDNFDAARPQNTPGSPYWSVDKGGATIVEAGYDSSDPYGGSGHSLSITYDVYDISIPDTYCSWMLELGGVLGGIDVSYLNMLGFYVKGAIGGKNFNVYLNDGTNREFVDIRDYLTLRDDWHYVKIPLADFANKGVDLSHIEKLEIVFEWEEMSGTVYIDNIEFTNGLFKETSIGPVRISGQTLLVQGKPFVVQGVCYQPTPINKRPYSTVEPPGDPYSDPDFHDSYYDYSYDPMKAEYNRQMWERDLGYLRDMHCNTIRTWSKVTSTAFLDACYNGGIDPIYVIMGIWVNHYLDYSIPENRMAAIDEFAEYVDTYKNHPAVLMWAIGNEDNYWYGGTKRDLYTLINEMARTAYEKEGPTYHPVTFPNGDLYYIGDDSVRATDTAMNYLDLWSSNTYRGLAFADFFIEYQSKSTKPVLITEYGIDAWDNIGSVEYEGEQANYAISAWNEFIENSDFCVGATIMAYSDEWWKHEKKYWDTNTRQIHLSIHDLGGYSKDTHPDGFSNEEWWGVMRTVDNGADIDIMESRQVYYALKEKWSTELLIDDFNDGADPNELGGAMGTFATPDSYCNRYYDQMFSYGGSGFSLKIDYGVAIDGYSDYYTSFQNLDARKYNSISFMVKGEHGGELFKVGLKDSSGNETKIPVTDYLLQGVTTEWQKVAIPLAAFKDITDRDELDNFSIIFEQEIDSGSGTIYIDDVWLEKKTAPLFVDNFNDDIPQNALLGNLWTVNDPGVTISTGYDTANPYGGIGKSYYITYSDVPPDSHCAWVAGLNGVDVSSKDTLSFYIRGAAGGEIPNVYLNDGSNKKFVNIEDYVTVTIDWQRVNIPLYDFLSQGVDLTHLIELLFVFESENMSGTIYLDDIAFVNYSMLMMPTLDELPEFTNMTPITLSGTKAPGTGIFINGVEAAGIDDTTDWSYEFPLVSGENIIRLIARDSQNNESEEVMAIVILDTELPFAYAGPDQNVSEDTVVYFDGSDSTDNSGIASYAWDFGDGSPEENGARVTHIYTTHGVYTAILTVYDLAGNGPVIDEAVITVREVSVKLTTPPADHLIIVNDPYGLARNDSTINVTVNNYPVNNVRHTGYIVEISDSTTFELSDYAIFTYWHKSATAEDAKLVNEDVNFDIDLNLFVGAEAGDIWGALPSSVYVRVRAARYEYAPSGFDGLTQVDLSTDLLLESPQTATLLNNDEDSIVEVVIYPRTPEQRTSGIIETGYMINFLPGDGDFATASWGDMYHVYIIYDKDANGIPDEVDVESLTDNVDISIAVERGIFAWPELLANGVIARVSSIRKGFTASAPVDAGSAPVSNETRLQNPISDKAQVLNDDNDKVITVIVENYDPINLGGGGTPPNWKDTPHTGYRIDICRDDTFEFDDTFHFYYTYDYDGDGVADEISTSIPGDDIKIDIDLDLAREILGDDFISAGGTVYVRIIAARAEYAVNYEDLHNFTVSFQNLTRLENPDYYAQVYNSEPGSPPDKMDRTITVEIANYNPSSVASGNNLKDSQHTGYQIDICKDQIFKADKTLHYYYIYDPDADGIPDEINSSVPEAIKVHIDLDLARDVLGDAFINAGGTVYLRLIAIRGGYAVNYEDLPGTPLSVDFLDRTLLTEPPYTMAMNPKNSNSIPVANDIDSSIFVYIDLITPGNVIHDGYQHKIDIVGSDGKTYSKMTYVTNLAPDVNGDIPGVRNTIDVKRLFENDPNPYNRLLLEDFIGIPAEAIEEITLTIASTKAGYTSSVSVEPTLPIGLNFKNTSDTFLPEITNITVMNLGGVATARVELGTYPFAGIPATAPNTPAGYAIQCSSDPAFPFDDDGDVTITTYADASNTDPITVNIDVAGLLGTATNNNIYVRARFIKDGYTPGIYTDSFTITVAVPPPVADFTAFPKKDSAPLTVDFTSECTGDVTTYDWDFGDGNLDIGASTSHTYNESGKYSVTLFVAGPGGSDRVEKVDYITVADTTVQSGENIQDVVESVSDGAIILVPGGAPYVEDITVEDKDVTIVGEGAATTTISGNITLKESNSSIEGLHIVYDGGEEITYTNGYYSLFKLLGDAGITAINSEITVKDCIIEPTSGYLNCGKGIQIWNLYGEASIDPLIENNLIINAETGIYLFSQAFGGAIRGEIKNSTFDNNDYGIVMRMYKENPAIHNNIISTAQDAIHITYDSLLRQRIGNILDNCFGRGSFDVVNDVWCDALEPSQLTPPAAAGNIGEDPDYDFDYTPQNPNCDDMGWRLE